MMARLRSRAEPLAYMLMRICVGLLFAFHGAQKLFGLFGGVGGHRVAVWSQLGAAGVIELLGGVLVTIGIATSPVAFICSGEMAFAYYLSHLHRGLWPIQNGGELPVLYCFVFLYISMRGRR